MKDSLIILAVFIAGIILARATTLPALLVDQEVMEISLLCFMFLAGISIGASSVISSMLRQAHWWYLLLPLATTVGTFAGSLAAYLTLSLSLPECLSIGAGFGYYSLSSIFIAQYKGADLGTIALISNILRELITLVLMPWLVLRFGPVAAIACGGATTMDTTLPSITRYCGPQWIFPALVHAMVLDASVPFWVTLFCSI